MRPAPSADPWTRQGRLRRRRGRGRLQTKPPLGSVPPTRDVGGGTVLLKMADLNLVQVRTLVDETDIGKIQPGQRATVTVDAFPNRPFRGSVLKVEPQAQTEQNVTMFPVLIRINN